MHETIEETTFVHLTVQLTSVNVLLTAVFILEQSDSEMNYRVCCTLDPFLPAL